MTSPSTAATGAPAARRAAAPGPERPLRADARRNRDLLVEAAGRAFRDATEAGEVSLEAIARDAGVGIGTLYRNFPTRQDLLVEVYRRDVDALVAAAETDGTAPEDAWDALSRWIGRFLEFGSTKSALLSALANDTDDSVVTELKACKTQIIAASERMLKRAQAAGQVRTDVTPRDVVRLFSGINMTRGVDREQRRLMGQVVLDGLRVRS